MLIDTSYNTEADIQFELGSRLKDLGFSVFFERNFNLPDFVKTKRSRKTTKIRVDVVVMRGDKIVGVIEVKNNLCDKKPKGRQLSKYKSLGLPFYFCWNKDDIENSIRFILEQ